VHFYNCSKQLFLNQSQDTGALSNCIELQAKSILFHFLF
jgi:hypothetical protein